eukprot:SAG31_NODE_1941_length_6859_cov_3.362278_2_plen_461_part_00
MAAGSAVDNPVISAVRHEGGDDDLHSDVETAARALREATLFRSDIRSVEAMERLLLAREAVLRAELEAKMGSRGTTAAADAIRSVVARLSEAPTNWHQAVVLFATLPPGDKDAGRSIWAMFCGVTMVLLQCAVVVGVLGGIDRASCTTKYHCEKTGTFCDIGGVNRCVYCGDQNVLPWQTDPRTGGTLNNPNLDDYVGFNETLVAEVCGHPASQLPDGVASWCESCVSPIDLAVDTLTGDALARANVSSMGLFDWFALVLSTFIVALTVVGELKDIELVKLAVLHAADKLTLRWRMALAVLCGMRRWLFLPYLVLAVPWLLLNKGGDALSVCFNSVAVLFLCEADNIAYRVLLNERVRSRVEAQGCVDLADDRVTSLARAKLIHTGLITAAIPAGVWSSQSMAMITPPLVFLIAGVAAKVSDVVASGGEAKHVCKGILEVALAWTLGALGFVVLFAIPGF